MYITPSNLLTIRYVLLLFFQAAGPVFESLDALFTGRRENAGQSAGSPLFGEIMFYNQQSVDQFVAQYNSPAVNTEV